MPIPSASFPRMNKRRYDQALTERERGMPAQYITGHQEFWGMDFIVTPAVLIPRPETEHVIETVLQLARVGRAPSPAALLRIVDVGTGSGCIALALAKELPQAEIHATDISSAALEIARANAARHQLEAPSPIPSNRFAAGVRARHVRFRCLQSALCWRIGRRPGATRSPQV